MKKIITSILITMLMSVGMMGAVYAAQLETTIDITASTTEVSAGDKVVFSFILKNVKNATDNSIGAIEGVVTYDTNFYELVTGVTNTSFTAGGESGGKFNVMCGDAKEGDTVAIMTLKVKDNPTGNGVVKFTNLSASDGDVNRGDEAVAVTTDKTITISLKSTNSGEDKEEPSDTDKTPTDTTKPSDTTTPSDDTTNPSETPSDTTTTPSEETPTTDGVTVSVGSNTTDTTTANATLPKAGTNIILVIALVVTLTIAVVAYNKSKKFRDIK